MIKGSLTAYEIWQQYQVQFTAWLAWPYADRQTQAMHLNFESMLEALNASPESSTDVFFSSLLNNYLCLLLQTPTDFCQASDCTENFTKMLVKLRDIPKSAEFLMYLVMDQAHWLTWLLLNATQAPLPASWEEAVDAANCFYYALFPILAYSPLLPHLIKEFIVAGDLFHTHRYYREALPYYSHAYLCLTLEEINTSEIDVYIEKINFRIKEMAKTVIMDVRERYFSALKAILTKSFVEQSVVIAWQETLPFLKALDSERDYANLAFLYEGFEVILMRSDEFLDDFSKYKGNAKAIECVYATYKENYLNPFEQHQRYALAEAWYGKLEEWLNVSSGCVNTLQVLRNECSLKREALQRKKNSKIPLQALSEEVYFPVFYQSLACYRKTLKQKLRQPEGIVNSQVDFTQKMKSLLGKIAHHITRLLGEPPCAFTLLGLGSLCREDMNLESDIDAALLIELEKHRSHPYFCAWLSLWLFYLQSLGDIRPFWFSLGLQDAADFKNVADLSTEPYVQTPAALAEWVITTDPQASPKPVRALYRPLALYAYGTVNLFAKYLAALYQRLEFNTNLPLKMHQMRAKEALESHAQAVLQTPIQWHIQRTRFSWLMTLKTYFTKPFVDIALALGFYHGLITQEEPPIFIAHLPRLLHVLKEKKCLAPYFITWLEEAWLSLQSARCQLHLMTEGSVFPVALQDTLNAIHAKILLPLSTCALSLLQQNNLLFDPIEAWFKEQAFQHFKNAVMGESEIAALQVWLASRVCLKAPLDVYQAVYEQGSMNNQALFLEIADTVKVDKPTLAALAVLPRANGYRLIEHQQGQHLEAAIHSLFIYEKALVSPNTGNVNLSEPLYCAKCPDVEVLPNPDEVFLSVWLGLSGDTAAYALKPMVLQHLIDGQTGRLRAHPLHPHTQADTSHRHRVIALHLRKGAQEYTLYFKEKPDHPAMDFAVYSLRQRLFGHGAAVNRLAKITVVNRNPKNSYIIDYPVLISTGIGDLTNNVIAL